MPGWKFWDKKTAEPETPVTLEPAGRFNIRPRTDLVGGALPADDARAARITTLRKRRDGVLFDVEQATLAGEAENPWLDRVATIDEAARAVEADLRRLHETRREAPGAPLPDTAVEIVAAEAEPSPRVVIRIGGTELVYVEDLDWAERGFQIARTELHLEQGDLRSLLPADGTGSEREELVEVLGGSLFRIATDARDRGAAGGPWPAPRRLSELAVPDPEFGGWLEIDGTSPRRREHALRFAELTAELERLRAERDRELEEMARWRERLPVAQRRLRDVDEEVAAALAGEGGRS